MVGILDKIKLVTKHRVDKIINSFDEIHNDFIFEKTFIFEKGKLYGIVGEHGEGGELISALMSGRIPIMEEEIYYDDVKVDLSSLQDIGWYVGKSEYSKGVIKREISVRKALNYAITSFQRYKNIDEIIKDFHLAPSRLNYELSKYSGERWRASLAIGYACRKKVYCFSWMNTAEFNNILLGSGVFRFFKKMKEEGMIVILSTSRKENVAGFVDEIIEINNPQYKSIISENPYFIENF